MNISQLSIQIVFSCLLSLCCFNEVFAETIYQWTDPWGQVKYSKTQVPGSMVSELTQLPKIQKVTEQQKQHAMLNKIQEIEDSNAVIRQKKSNDKLYRQQIIKNENHCRKLRNLLTDVRLRNSRYYNLDRYNLSGRHYNQRPYYFADRYDFYSYEFLENDLYWEIREHCH